MFQKRLKSLKKVFCDGGDNEYEIEFRNVSFKYPGTEEYVLKNINLEIKDNDRNVVLCHYPIPCFKNHFYGWIHLYGHVHNSFESNMMEHTKYLIEELYGKQCQMFNVGAMMPLMNYTPRTLDEIINNG